MRTTVDLPDELLRPGSGLAAEEGRTPTALLTDWLRRRLERPALSSSARRALPVSRNGGGLHPWIDPDVLVEAPGEIVRAGSAHWPRLADLCRRLQLRGNLAPDAYLAALALEQRAELITFDRGFGRYPRLRRRCLIDD